MIRTGLHLVLGAYLGILNSAPAQTTPLAQGPSRPRPLAIEQGSFEDWSDVQPSWQFRGDVHQGAAGTGYYGSHAAIIEGPANSKMSTELLWDEVSRKEVVGKSFEAGVWVRLQAPMALPSAIDPSFYFELRLVAFGDNTEETLSRARWYPIVEQEGHWVYVKTQPDGVVERRHKGLRLEMSRSFPGSLAVDFAQWGQEHSVSGNPGKLVGCNYVGRYRAPQFAPGPDPSTAAERWRNWHWQVPTACSGSFTGFYHSPDCNGNADCRRSSGRRNSAASPLLSEFDLPLVGSYDSRDPAILDYHVQLAQSAGIDHFIYDHQGLALAQQDIALGRDPVNESTWNALVNACEKPGVQLKLAVMYEPKVHMLGWVYGQATKAQKVAGITSDLVALALQMRGKRCTLQHHGRMVVFLFRNGSCDQPATQCLTDADWAQIHGDVLAQTNIDLFLVGDTAPGPGSVIKGLTRWQLLRRDYLKYRTWQDARDGVPTLPVPQLASLAKHVGDLDASIQSWLAQGPADRVGILTLWPGFDDTGVGGWGVTNLTGEDGNPLCVRVAEEFNGAFYSTTVARAFDGNYDWVQIATWNDWNEATRIEPAWHPNYIGPMLVGQGPDAATSQQVFGRLKETRQWISAFKGQPIQGPSFRFITNQYFKRAWHSPTSPIYD